MMFETFAVSTITESGTAIGTALYRVLDNVVLYVILDGGRAGEIRIAPNMEEAVRQVRHEMFMDRDNDRTFGGIL